MLCLRTCMLAVHYSHNCRQAVPLQQMNMMKAGIELQEVPSGIALRQPLPPGIPSEEEFIAAYSAARGIPPPPLPSLAFHLALSMFRIASILAGVGARAAQGNASSAHAAQVGKCNATTIRAVISQLCVIAATPLGGIASSACLQGRSSKSSLAVILQLPLHRDHPGTNWPRRHRAMRCRRMQLTSAASFEEANYSTAVQ